MASWTELATWAFAFIVAINLFDIAIALRQLLKVQAKAEERLLEICRDTSSLRTDVDSIQRHLRS